MGLCRGCGLGVERLVAADKMFSSFSIRSILRMCHMFHSGRESGSSYLSRFPLARISSTICMDSARLTGPLPVITASKFEPQLTAWLPVLVTLGEGADLGVPDDGDRLVSGEAGLGSDTFELKLSRLGYSPGSQS